MSAILITPIEYKETDGRENLVVEVQEWVGKAKRRNDRIVVRLPIPKLDLIRWMKAKYLATTVVFQESFLIAEEGYTGEVWLVGPEYP